MLPAAEAVWHWKLLTSQSPRTGPDTQKEEVPVPWSLTHQLRQIPLRTENTAKVIRSLVAPLRLVLSRPRREVPQIRLAEQFKPFMVNPPWLVFRALVMVTVRLTHLFAIMPYLPKHSTFLPALGDTSTGSQPVIQAQALVLAETTGTTRRTYVVTLPQQAQLTSAPRLTTTEETIEQFPPLSPTMKKRFDTRVERTKPLAFKVTLGFKTSVTTMV